jgi:pimeloyl-ACP methyl ester carboxylesterase
MAARRRDDTSDEVKPFAYMGARSSFGPAPDPEQVQFTMRLGRATPPRVVADATMANLAYDVRVELGAVDVPALVIRGAADRLSTARSTEQLRRALAQPQIETIDGVGHLPMLESRETFNQLLICFSDRLQAK